MSNKINIRWRHTVVEYFKMKIFTVLTTRWFAILLLCVSIVFLILWKSYNLSSPLFFIAPMIVFLSVSLCTVKRFLVAGLSHDIRFWGSVTFHIGLLIIIATVSLGGLTRFLATATLPQGVGVNLLSTDFIQLRTTPYFAEIPYTFLKLNWQTTQYKDKVFPVDYAANISIGFIENERSKMIDETVRINAPIILNGYRFLLIDVNLSPLFIVRDNNGETLFKEFIKIAKNTTSEDIFDISKSGLTVYTRFFPDMFKQDGKYGTRSREPKNPAFGIRITSKEDPFKDIWKGVLKIGEKAKFKDMTLEFADLKPVVIVEIVKDPTYWGIVAGWVAIVAGLLLRYIPSYLKKEIKRIQDIRNTQ